MNRFLCLLVVYHCSYWSLGTSRVPKGARLFLLFFYLQARKKLFYSQILQIISGSETLTQETEGLPVSELMTESSLKPRLVLAGGLQASLICEVHVVLFKILPIFCQQVYCPDMYRNPSYSSYLILCCLSNPVIIWIGCQLHGPQPPGQLDFPFPSGTPVFVLFTLHIFLELYSCSKDKLFSSLPLQWTSLLTVRFVTLAWKGHLPRRFP